MQVQRMVQRQAHSTQREGVLAAIGGITIDPIVPDALRMRRFYVRPAFRRTGIRGEIAQALLKSARSIPLVTLKCRRQECSVLENSGVRATSSHLEHRLPEMGCTGNPPTIICRSRHSIAGYPKP